MRQFMMLAASLFLFGGIAVADDSDTAKDSTVQKPDRPKVSLVPR
ncbi:MAG: hypothetical protein SGI97_05140 [candidate division Zixibacteria bacterium]|nr:hypothetical protein [candidate division Zixibacteria bacterium]